MEDHHQKRLGLYCSLMEEIKPRLAIIRQVATGAFGPMPARFVQECCYLQLRMICELIALACLVAHGDIAGTRTASTRKHYEADWMMGMLQKLHPHFYPKPLVQHLVSDATPNSPRHFHMEEIKTGFLTRNDLVACNRECGKALHRGTVEDVLSLNPRQLSLKKVNEWHNKVVTLLNLHMIRLIDRKHLYCVVFDAISDGRVHASVAVPEDGGEYYSS
jgi:hypothetical protein